MNQRVFGLQELRYAPSRLRKTLQLAAVTRAG